MTAMTFNQAVQVGGIGNTPVLAFDDATATVSENVNGGVTRQFTFKHVEHYILLKLIENRMPLSNATLVRAFFEELKAAKSRSQDGILIRRLCPELDDYTVRSLNKFLFNAFRTINAAFRQEGSHFELRAGKVAGSRLLHNGMEKLDTIIAAGELGLRGNPHALYEMTRQMYPAPVAIGEFAPGAGKPHGFFTSLITDVNAALKKQGLAYRLTSQDTRSDNATLCFIPIPCDEPKKAIQAEKSGVLSYAEILRRCGMSVDETGVPACELPEPSQAVVGRSLSRTEARDLAALYGPVSKHYGKPCRADGAEDSFLKHEFKHGGLGCKPQEVVLSHAPGGQISVISDCSLL